MHWADHIVWRCGQEGEEEVLAGLALAGAGPGPLDTGEGIRFALSVHREPVRDLQVIGKRPVTATLQRAGVMCRR